MSEQHLQVNDVVTDQPVPLSLPSSASVDTSATLPVAVSSFPFPTSPPFHFNSPHEISIEGSDESSIPSDPSPPSPSAVKFADSVRSDGVDWSPPSASDPPSLLSSPLNGSTASISSSVPTPSSSSSAVPSSVLGGAMSASFPSPPSSASFPSFAPPTPLPSFASPEAVALDSSLHSKRHDLYLSLQTIEQTKERIQILQQHLLHVQTEHSHGRVLLQNKQRDSTSQRHLSALLDREDGRLHQDVSSLSKNAAATQAALTSLQASKVRLEDELSEFQCSMNWSNEQLLQWSLASKQKEEDRLLLLEFGRLDEVKVRELRKKVNEVVAAVDQAKADLGEVETESAELVMTSEQLSREYKKAYDQKMRIIAEWEESVNRMHRGDERLMRLGEEVVDGRREVKAWEARVQEVDQFSGEELRHNKRMLGKIEESERLNGKVRDEWQRQKAAIVEMEEEVITKRNIMEKLEMEVRQAQQKETALHSQRAEREAQVKELTLRLQQAQTELKDEVATLKTVANQHEHLTASLMETEAKVTSHQQAVVRRKEELYQLSVQLNGERQKEEQGVIEIANAQGTSKALQGKIHAMDLSSIKQQEMLYQIEFVIQGLERKVNEASGKRSVEENEQLRSIMEELKLKREKEEAELLLLDSQVKRLQDDLRGVNRRFDAATTAMKRKEEEVATLKVSIEAQQRSLSGVQRRVEELRVSHDKSKLDVLKLRSKLQEEQDGVWEEDKKRVDIIEAIAVRKEEIARYEELQRVDLKGEEGERGKLTRELKEKERALEMLKKKYSTLHAKFVGSEVGREEEQEGEEGVEAKSQGYYIVKAGLEREEELRRRNQLMAEQKKIEEEIEGLTRITLEMEGKSTPSRATSTTGSDQAEVERVNGELRGIEREVFELAGKERQQRREVENRKGVLAGLISEIGQVIAQVRVRQEEVGRLAQVKAQLEGSQARAQAVVDRKLKEFKGKRKTGEEEKGGGGGADEELSDVLLYTAVQEGKRRFAVMREMMRGFLLEHEDMQGIGGELMEILEVEVRPSSAASSIVSHLSEEKDAEGGGNTGRSLRSEGSDGAGSKKSPRADGGVGSQKSTARGLTGGGSRRSTSERLLIDARGIPM